MLLWVFKPKLIANAFPYDIGNKKTKQKQNWSILIGGISTKIEFSENYELCVDDIYKKKKVEYSKDKIRFCGSK